MAKITIRTSDGKEYPCRVTMGALLRFKHVTGKDVSELDGDTSDMIALLWCCTASACNADKMEFGYDLTSFADMLEPDALNKFTEALNASSDGTKKKTAKRQA
jgi:hypothetical protein